MAFYIFFLALFIALLTCEKAVPPNDFLFLIEFSGVNKLYILSFILGSINFNVLISNLCR